MSKRREENESEELRARLMTAQGLAWAFQDGVGGNQVGNPQMSTRTWKSLDDLVNDLVSGLEELKRAISNFTVSGGSFRTIPSDAAGEKVEKPLRAALEIAAIAYDSIVEPSVDPPCRCLESKPSKIDPVVRDAIQLCRNGLQAAFFAHTPIRPFKANYFVVRPVTRGAFLALNMLKEWKREQARSNPQPKAVERKVDSQKTAVEPLREEFVREGQVWRITFEGRTIHLPHSKGLEYIQRLLGLPGEAVSVKSLEPSHEVSSSRGEALSDADALEEYRQTFNDLQTELEQARQDGDDHGVERIREEMAQLGSVLQQSTALGTRPRRFAGSDDRLRVRVAQGIKRSLGKIGAELPRLREHLQEAIVDRAGMAPSYRPAKPRVWRLQ
jgi:hypothetical protein